MKRIIDISEDDLDAIKFLKVKGWASRHELLILNGTPIPDNATNGDMIKAIFPEIEIIDIRTIIDCPEEGTVYFECFEGDNIHSLDLSWWNSPYQKGGKE